jgi:hypothetical protein
MLLENFQDSGDIKIFRIKAQNQGLKGISPLGEIGKLRTLYLEEHLILLFLILNVGEISFKLCHGRTFQERR